MNKQIFMNLQPAYVQKIDNYDIVYNPDREETWNS